MRFLGNKESIVKDIEDLFREKKLFNKDLTLFDPFIGTGSISEHFKSDFKIIGNDLLQWCTVYSYGRIHRDKCKFDKLGFNPIKYLNSNNETIRGFFYSNYSPAESQRMYFSEFNAGRIDYFRQTIELWYQKNLITNIEYHFLLASLLESVSLVSNIAGVYGAFLKHWDSRALKEIEFIEVNNLNHKSAISFNITNDKIEDIIEDVDCDILYLDPPYTQNQYGTQYHLLETLIKYDSPSISKITGSRKTSPMRSDWSKNFKSHILLDKVLSSTTAKHVVLSYSSDGLMSKKYIESVMKRYGKTSTFDCREIQYKKYRNSKTVRTNKHFEYLFYIEKETSENIYFESPLIFVGSKFKYINQISKLLPNDFETLFDLFGGGFNFGINSQASKIIYNDFNWIVSKLIKSFFENDTYDYLMYIKRIEKKFNLQVENKESYLALREFYNSKSIDERDPKLLYTLILYGFQQQIRFNSKYDFNNPSGNRWFNDNVMEKIVSFCRVIKEKNIIFESKDYKEFNNEISVNDFVYLDPPYRNTTGTYNDGKRGFNGWCLDQENELIEFIDSLDRRNIRFMLSYVIEHKGIINENIVSWIENNKYKLISLEKEAGRSRQEVVIINYEQ